MTRSGSRPASASARRAASGEGPRRGGAAVRGVGWLTSWSRMSIGSDRKTGPPGGVRRTSERAPQRPALPWLDSSYCCMLKLAEQSTPAGGENFLSCVCYSIHKDAFLCML